MNPVPLKRIGDVAKAKGGKRLPKGMEVQNEETAHPYLRVVDFGPDGIDRSDIKFIPNEAFECVSRYTITSDDIYVSIAGTIGRVGIVPDDLSGANLTENAAKITEISSSVDKRYLLYFLRSAAGQGALQGKAGGTSQPKLALFRIEEIEFPCPPLRDQQAIASTLSAYDDLIENNRRRMALLEDAARQLYREWFVRLRFPGHEHTPVTIGVPEGWEKTTAIFAMEVLSGGTPKTSVSDYWDGDIPFYTPKDATERCFVLETERSITELGLKNCNSRLYAPDTVFISARGTVGKLNLALRSMAMSQSCYALLGKRHVRQLFLFCALKEAIEHFKQHAVGAVFDAIVVDTFKLIPFTVPHEKMVRLFEEIVTPMFRKVANLMEQNQKLRAARDLLLPRLMSGEIAV
ncbi:MAG: restriction endonuclease subunit S [Candidatus Latescibacterota bacterium]